MESIRVILADDHPVVRAGVRRLLEGLTDIEVLVVEEASNGYEAMDLIEQHQPDIVFMDISMPGLNGLEVAERIAGDFPDVHVLILSVHNNEKYIGRALRAGAAGYLVKDANPLEYEMAVQAVARGGSYLGPEISKQLIERYVDQADSPQSPLDQLTRRHREILQLIAEGKKNREIAEILHLSVKTVETHRGQLMDLLDIHNIAGLVRFAIRIGLVEP